MQPGDETASTDRVYGLLQQPRCRKPLPEPHQDEEAAVADSNVCQTTITEIFRSLESPRDRSTAATLTGNVVFDGIRAL